MVGKYEIVLYKSNKNKEGKYPVNLRVSKRGRMKYISLNLCAHEEEWDKKFQRFYSDKRHKGTNINHEKYNELLLTYEKRASDILDSFRKENTDWTLEQFVNEFDSKLSQGNVSEYLDRHIAKLKETKHFGNAKVYGCLREKLKHLYSSYERLSFSEIDINFVIRFDHDLEKESLCGNYRSLLHRTLRSLINKAIKEKYASEKTYPYGVKGFNVKGLEQETRKRHLDDDTLCKFKNEVGKDIHAEIARRIFLFTFYCNGMSFVDAARLTSKNMRVSDGKTYIEYRREKTKNSKTKNITFVVFEEIQSILDWFRGNTLLVDDFLLPIVTVSGCKEDSVQLYNHINNRYRRISKYLKRYCKEISASSDISSYWSRHTFAQRIYKNLGMGIAKQMLGHKSLSTTETYIAGFDVAELSGEIEKILNK